MQNTVTAAEPVIRLGAFLGVLLAMMAWEALAPRRPVTLGRLRRWPSNLGVVALDTAIVRLLFPLTAVGVAILARAHGIGLLNAWPIPAAIAMPLAVAALDFVIYAQHVAFHAVPWLWRLHRMHHADTAFDVTTGLRFHPIEIALSMLIKFAAVLLLGAPPLAVLVFEVLLNATAMFNHGNVRLPLPLDRVLRLLVVTPDMHRVHHSVIRRETDSNFGFNLPWWDRLCGTYRAQPALGHDAMSIGIEQFRDPADLRLDRMLIQPFQSSTTPAAEPARRALGMVLRGGALLALAAAGAWVFRHHGSLDTAALQHRISALGIWAPVAFIAVYAAGTVAFFSGAVLTLAGGALFGPIWGTLWNLTGATLGATIAFLLARGTLGPWVARRTGGRLRALIDGVNAEGWRFVALMRLMPVVPFNLLNYALGLTSVSLPAYILASAICMLPGTAAYTWIGHAGAAGVSGNLAALRYGLLGLGALTLIAFLPRLIRRLRPTRA